MQTKCDRRESWSRLDASTLHRAVIWLGYQTGLIGGLRGDMSVSIVWIGVGAGLLLLGLLLVNLRYRHFGMWPVADPAGWKSWLFWSLFRTANVSALTLAAVDWQPGVLQSPERMVSAITAARLGLAYLRSCMTLGSGNLYCGRHGLNCSGIYRLSRNPQYATAIAAYALLVVASSAAGMLPIVIILIAVYSLMARNEEPWLSEAYGAAYQEYVAEVPRFFGMRSLIGLVGANSPSQRRHR